MKKLLAVSCALAGVLLALSLFASPASAQASRTWVSGVGDDANPCSRTAPCKTFAGTISKTALNGEINCLDPGGFGTITITKSITIDCHEVFGSLLSAGTNAINIPFDSFAGGDVRKTVNIRNVNIQGFDSGLVGINITGNGTGSFVHVEDCLIDGIFGGAATGILDARVNGTLTVLDTTIRNMGSNGISIAGATAGAVKATLSNVRVVNSNTGIAVGTNAAVFVSHSVVASNATAGFSASGTDARILIDSTAIVQNGTAIVQSGGGGGGIIISNNDINYNNVAFTGAVFSYTNNRVSQNNSAGTPVTPNGTTTNPTGQE